MKIYWKDESLRKKVEKYARSNEYTQRRMVSIEEANNFSDLVPASAGRAHFLKGKVYAGCFAVDFGKQGSGNRLICKPYGDFKRDAKGQFIKKTIQEIMIVKVEDYHKK